MTTLGKQRHLSRCTTPNGHFAIIAIDHRGNLRTSLDASAPKPLTDAAFTQFKQDIVAGLLPGASAVLIDPAYGIGPGIHNHLISGEKGLLAPLEVTDYDLHPSEQSMSMIPYWGVGKIKRVGGDGVKLLLPYHPEAANAAEKQALVRQIVDECGHYDIPFFLEPIAYSLDKATPLSDAEVRQIVVEMAALFSTMGVDILKMQFPADAKQNADETAWKAACKELNAASKVPWALLSAGVDFATFAKQAEIACSAGASGVIVGRAVWTEAVQLQGSERQAFIQTTARNRMLQLARICQTHARSVFDDGQSKPIQTDWYADYASL
jgi:tagatose 1,6-diphosphate aldolase